MTLALRYSAVSDIGSTRANNQDSGFADGHLLVVADGVGGATSGDIASAVTVQAMRRIGPTDDGELMLEALAGSIHRANVRLGELIDDDARLDGMGTTVTAMLFDGEQVALAHVGDSRAYLLRDGELSQLSHDHTFVQTLVDEGRISASEARTHPHRNLIMKVLDGKHESEPDLTMHQLLPGDRLLLCSDGLTAGVEDDKLTEVLAEGTPDWVALELVHLAIAGGSQDNVTVVVADVVDADEPIDPDSAAAVIGPLLVGSAAEQARDMLDDTTSQPPIVLDEDAVSDPIDREQMRYAPRPPQRFRWLRRLVVALVIVALLVVAGVLGYQWTQRQFYVAGDGSYVAIFRGVDVDLPGVSLSSVEQDTTIRLDQLSRYWRDQVDRGMDANSLAEAREIVARLAERAEQCPPGQTCSGDLP